MAIGPVRGKSWGGPHGRLPVAQTDLAKAARSTRSTGLPLKDGRQRRQDGEEDGRGGSDSPGDGGKEREGGGTKKKIERERGRESAKEKNREGGRQKKTARKARRRVGLG